MLRLLLLAAADVRDGAEEEGRTRMMKVVH
jgi:hypothetical protein